MTIFYLVNQEAIFIVHKKPYPVLENSKIKNKIQLFLFPLALPFAVFSASSHLSLRPSANQQQSKVGDPCPPPSAPCKCRLD
jgi:hypothetical protein